MATIEEVAKLSETLNMGMERLMAAYFQYQEKLQALKIQVPAEIDLDPQFQLGWRKITNEWKLVIIDRKVNQTYSFFGASRKLKIQAAERLHHLTDRLFLAVIETTSEVGVAADLVEKTLEEIQDTEEDHG